MCIRDRKRSLLAGESRRRPSPHKVGAILRPSGRGSAEPLVQAGRAFRPCAMELFFLIRARDKPDV
eukprot:7471371-Alexandrium_andersonii.AAC.1